VVVFPLLVHGLGGGDGWVQLASSDSSELVLAQQRQQIRIGFRLGVRMGGIGTGDQGNGCNYAE
jgi:hypothetical protein